jgi:glycosyltransferase involved in cell wall biosynthesis
MKVLTISQLPLEVGGNYTTGAANAVYELSCQSVEGVQQYMYGTNIKDKVARRLCKYPKQYMGYRMSLLTIITNVISHPIDTINEWKFYHNICHENPIRMEFYKANIKRAIYGTKPDIIHIHGSGMAPLYFAAKNLEIPILRTYHGMVFKNDGNKKYQKVGDEAIGTRSFANFYTALTEENKKEVENLGIASDKISIIPNGCDARKFHYDEAERFRIRKEQNVGTNTKVFITVGLLIDRKGQMSFLKILEKSGIDYQYWLFGKGPDYDVIKDYVKAHGLESKIRLFGQINGNELYMYLSAADVYAHASTTEGQSLAEIEAFSTGLRIIVNSLISGTVVGDSKNDKDIYYTMDFSKPDFSSLISWLNDNHKERTSRPYVDWSFIANQYGELYKSIISNKCCCKEYTDL